jgi:hypothetical protein
MTGSDLHLLSLVDFGVGHGAAVANLLRQQADQVLVVDVFLAVGQGDEAVVVCCSSSREGQSRAARGVAQCGAAGVLAEDELRAAAPTRGGRHDLVAERVGQHAVLVNAGLVREGVGADDGLVGRGPKVMIWPRVWLVG